jgi:potassium efflux system protein
LRELWSTKTETGSRLRQFMKCKPFTFPHRRIRAALLLAVSVLALLAVASASAQLIVPQTSTDAQAHAEWQPASLADLPANWWQDLLTESGDLDRERFRQFLASMKERVSGLDADNLVTAQSALLNLGNLYELLVVADQTGAPEAFEPVPTKDAYRLDDVLALRAQWRQLQKDAETIRLESAQSERQLKLLRDRRDSLLQDYQAAAVESPERILLGIERVAARVEYALSERQVDSLEEHSRQIEAQSDLLRQQQAFAREHLAADDTTSQELDAVVEAARASSVEATRKVAATRRQLLDVLSTDSINRSLELLRKQQLTRASAEAELATLREALTRGKAAWQRFRLGELDSRFIPQTVEARAEALSDEALRQVEVWSDATQATLVATPPGDDLNARKNLEIARSVARDTLAMIEQIRDTSDDLALVQGILVSDTIAAQSGLSKAWTRSRLFVESSWSWILRVVDYDLFSLGDTPVTPGALIKMLLILVIAWGISWIIRHLLDRATGRQQFAQSPVIYTTGRLLHYLIILIGVFAALSSIGLDFSNFALIAGALSVGIGFGLQAIVNNFVSGLILLFEGSLRIGDYIELDSGLAGVVKEINTRATVVGSNDGVDVVVPNSELVTTKLTNLTLRENMGRIRVPFGVAYGSDKEKVKEAALRAAEQMEFILLKMPGREPQVRLVNFGDSALEFELLAWLNRSGVRRPHRARASFLWALETTLKEAGIEVPFPQRDIHIKQPRSIREGETPDTSPAAADPEAS